MLKTYELPEDGQHKAETCKERALINKQKALCNKMVLNFMYVT